MKVVFDHQIFSLQKQGGISRYIFKLNEELIKLGVDTTIKVKWSENVYTPMTRSLPKLIPWRIRQLSYYLLNHIDDLFHPILNIDIYHATYYGSNPLRHNARQSAITVFDMLHEKGVVISSMFDSTVKSKRNTVFNSNLLFAISESTKKDIESSYSNIGKPIVVTHLGTEKVIPTAIDIQSFRPPLQYILYIGNRQGYKNFMPYLEAIRPLLKSHSISLVAFGGGEFTYEELRLIQQYEVGDKVHQVHGSDGLLSLYYENALFLSYPSLMEGFGLPIIEAFQYGCPVLTSNCSSMAEIGGDAACYFDPDNSSSMHDETKLMLSSSSMLQKAKTRGMKRSRFFSWKKTAEKTKLIYDKALETP